MNVDSLYTGTVQIDSMPVSIVAHDLGEKLNINTATETELQQFFSFLLSDYTKSTQLSQAIMDWRDADSVKRPSGAERDDYIKAGMLALPANTLFNDVSDLQERDGRDAGHLRANRAVSHDARRRADQLERRARARASLAAGHDRRDAQPDLATQIAGSAHLGRGAGLRLAGARRTAAARTIGQHRRRERAPRANRGERRSKSSSRSPHASARKRSRPC